jgi:hypothetical protein
LAPDGIVEAHPDIKDFSPQSQMKAAAYLASDTYKQATGRDLETDLNDPSKFAQIASALHGQWEP